jgi:hypothetical protein
MIESVSGIGSASLSAGVRSPAAAAAPTQGPSFDQALAQVIGSAVDTLQTGEAVWRRSSPVSFPMAISSSQDRRKCASITRCAS